MRPFHYLPVASLCRDTIHRYMEQNRPVPVRFEDIGGMTATLAGDTHGALDVTSKVIQTSRDSALICFLGDMVDRGTHQFENLMFILESSILDRRIVLVRGNHESKSMNEVYGFISQLISIGIYDEIYGDILNLYGVLPFALVINNRVLALHGGIPSSCEYPERWLEMKMNCSDPAGDCERQVLWNDPSETAVSFGPSPRGEGIHIFGRDAFDSFMEKAGLELLVRGHESVIEGYRWNFDERLLTIFSSRYHGGGAAKVSLRFGERIEASILDIPRERHDENGWE